MAGLAGVVALVVASCGTYEPAATEALMTTLPDTSLVEASGMSLVSYTPEETFLNHPTMLPEAWELCRHLETVDDGDRFCDPNDDDRWLQVSVEDGALLRLDQGDPIEGSDTGVWLARGESSQAAFPSGSRDVFVIISDALSDDELVAVAESIPLVVSRDSLYAEYEVPLDLALVTDEQLAGLLASIGEEVRVTRRDLEASVFTSVVILRLFAVDEVYVPQLALRIPKPRQIGSDRPVVVGESESRRRGYAIWDQRGYGWRLEGQITVEEASALALEIVELVAALPTG